ncbi:MAG: hypothetical protein GQF41_3656 [Candidatus Rifleibacterium amylolyticum]|nr:MAG: hypothetical protein GQF41_3656 [Candidatus Rifleibacterium amylolyticum]
MDKWKEKEASLIPKSELAIALILMISSVLLCYPCFKDTMNVLDDMPFHLGRIQSVAANLRIGNILPTVYGDAINNYGYASAFFYPDLWLYLPAMLVLSGFELLRAYQIFLFLITLATSLAMYYSTKKIMAILQIDHYCNIQADHGLKAEQTIALLATVFYIAFPYRLIDIYLRGALGEILAFVFIPVVAWGVTEILHVKNPDWKILMLGSLGLLYSHIISCFMVSILVGLIFAFNWKHSLQIKTGLAKLCLYSSALGAAFIIPLLEQMRSNKFYYNVRSPFGSLAEQSAVIAPALDNWLLLLLNLVLIALFYFYHNWLNSRQKDSRVALLVFASLYPVVMTTNLFPWEFFEQFPFVRYIQFPWRLFMFVCYFSSLSAGIILIKRYLAHRSQNFFFTVLGLVLVSGAFLVSVYTQPSPVVTRSLDYAPPLVSIGQAEYLPASFSFGEFQKSSPTPRLLAGNATITSYSKTGNLARLAFSQASDSFTIELPIIYYRGYTATVNNQPVKIEESSNGQAQVTINSLESGNLIVQYNHTLLQMIAYAISLTTIIYLLVTSFLSHLNCMIKGFRQSRQYY